MDHVDYADWAKHIKDLADEFHSSGNRILELGCGTGELSSKLAENKDWRVKATDISSPMIEKAKSKFGNLENCEFSVSDFRAGSEFGVFDVIILIHDGLNYCLEKDEIRDLFEAARASMDEHSIFIFDQSTPQNSLNNMDFFEDEGEENGVYYERTSRYDANTKHHENHFIIYESAESYEELHVQKAYAKDEISSLVKECDLEVVASYSGFSMEDADDKAERIHWVVRRTVNS